MLIRTQKTIWLKDGVKIGANEKADIDDKIAQNLIKRGAALPFEEEKIRQLNKEKAEKGKAEKGKAEKGKAEKGKAVPPK